VWKLKVDDKGVPILDANGHYIYVKPDNSEYVADIAQMVGKIGELTTEAKNNRVRAETAETSLKVFEGIDPAAAKTALQTVKDIKDGELIGKGKVEEVRAEITKSLQATIDAGAAENTALKGRLNNTLLSNAFANSKFAKDKLAIPVDIAQSSFGRNFTIDDTGKISAKGNDGNVIYSRKNAGVEADFDEAFEILVDQYPNKASILKGANNGGSGNQGAGAGNGSKRVYTRDEFGKLPNQAAVAKEIREGKAELVD
jgi:hypothetical protein